MTEVNSHAGMVVAWLLVLAFVGLAIVWATCKTASMSDAAMHKTFARMIPPENQKIESRFDEVKCRGCGMIYLRREMTALGWCGTCTFMLTTGTHWACKKCGAVVLHNDLYKDICWECRQVDTTGE